MPGFSGHCHPPPLEHPRSRRHHRHVGGTARSCPPDTPNDRGPSRCLLHADMPLSRRVLAEAIGTAFLLVAIIGSGIMGERLDNGNVAIALLANSIATGGALLCLIAALGPISGAHFNPAVSLADAMRGGLSWRELPLYVGAQILGAVAGVAAANAMFGLPAVLISHRARAGPALAFSEFLATFGLLL